MRRALQTADPLEPCGEEDETNTLGADEQTHKSRLPPESRGLRESRSLLVEVDLAPLGADGRGRKGTLTFANSVSELRRAGSSRETSGSGGSPLGKPERRAPPRRAQSCAQG